MHTAELLLGQPRHVFAFRHLLLCKQPPLTSWAGSRCKGSEGVLMSLLLLMPVCQQF